MAKGEFEKGLSLVQALLDEVRPLTRVNIPDALLWKGICLIGLDRDQEAHQILTEARSLASKQGANSILWLILAKLAEVNEKLGQADEAGANRVEARGILKQIGDSLHEVGLADSFMAQPRVNKLIKER